jgi:ankyrin repeat protein/5-methylcytosine-specific restriction endonuclease McrBC regulatory subunit McrC
MSRVITFFEHEKVFISENRDLKKRTLSKKDADSLLNLESKVFRRVSSKEIQTTSIVGSISLRDGIIIEILPKIGKGGLGSFRREFIKLLRFVKSRNSLLENSTSSKVSVKELPLISYIVELFSENLLLEMRKGLYLDYTKVIEGGDTIRGKVDIYKTLQRFPDRSKVVVEYRKRTENTNLYKVFKSISLLLLEDQSFSYRTKQNLFEVNRILEKVERVELRESDFERVQFTRLNSRFETLFHQARTIFYNYMPYTAKIGATPFWSILFDMNELFEKFVEELFRKSGISVKSQKSFEIYDGLSIRPDIVTENFVIDTKYKIYKNRPNREDIFQISTYMNALEKDGYLIAPSFEYREKIEFSPKMGGRKFEVIFLNIGSGIDEVLKNWKFQNGEKLEFVEIKRPFKIEKKKEIQLSGREKRKLRELEKKSKKDILLVASGFGELRIVKYLLENGFDVNHQAKNGVTALHTASRTGNIQMIKLLLEYGVNPDILIDDGSTPLHIASSYGHLEVAKLLLEHNANPDIQSRNKNVSLMFASSKGHLEIVKLLLEHNANPNIQDKNGMTTLHIAIGNGHAEIVKFLLEYGVNPNLENIYGFTSMEWADENNQAEIMEIFKERIEQLKKAIKEREEAEELAKFVCEAERLRIEKKQLPKLSLREMAIQILQKENREMKVSEIWELGKHLYSGNGKTPENTLNAILGQEENIFYRVGSPFKYGLIKNREAVELFDLGKEAFDSGDDVDEVIKVLSEAISLNPYFVEAYIQRAEAFFEAGNFEKAIEDYEKAKELNPEKEEFTEKIKECKLELTKYF